MAKVIICGDYAPTNTNEKQLGSKETKIENLIGEHLTDVFLQADFSVVNIETSLTDSHTPKQKRGQINRSNPDTVEFLKKIKTRVGLLANNHIIDNGNVGVEDTILALKKNGISYIGAGKNLREAQEPFIYQEGEKIVKILNIANEEFNLINDDTYGVNTLDLFTTFDWIKEQKKSCDYLIVVYHGGIEFYQYASPILQKICRKMVECGADLVSCQHSHCIGTIEQYDNSTIVYGQGNFIFDDTDDPLEQTAILLQVDTTTKEVSIIPIIKNGAFTRLANSNEKEGILNDISDRSSVTDLKEHFRLWCQRQQREIYNMCAGYYFLYKLINKISGRRLEKLVYSSKSKMRIYNNLKSIALFEMFEEVMRDY